MLIRTLLLTECQATFFHLFLFVVFLNNHSLSSVPLFSFYYCNTSPNKDIFIPLDLFLSRSTVLTNCQVPRAFIVTGDPWKQASLRKNIHHKTFAALKLLELLPPQSLFKEDVEEHHTKTKQAHCQLSEQLREVHRMLISTLNCKTD